MPVSSSSVSNDAPLDLRPEELELVRRILRAHVPGFAVWAFGSRTRKNAKPHADLDLAIIGDDPVGLNVLGALRHAFADSALPMKVDLVDWALTEASFRRIIEDQKVVVQ